MSDSGWLIEFGVGWYLDVKYDGLRDAALAADDTDWRLVLRNLGYVLILPTAGFFGFSTA